ncbi:MAG: BACON domain-containing protein, partial [Alistipes sp.]|nr:BACON domain-containing protein [Alistipes sp.]
AEPLAIDGDNAIYLIVYPQTLTADSELKFEASTEGYAIAKSITLPQDIELIGGAVNTLNVTINAEHLTAEDAGLALPFEDDFSWVGATSTTAFSSVTNKFPTRDEATMYSACATIYPENNTALKFSSGSKGGTLTTSELNLSEPFSVVVNAKHYSNTENTLTITVGEITQEVKLTADYADYIVEFEAASKKEKLTISYNKRFYLNDLKIVAGHDYVLPPVLTVSTDAESVSSGEGEFEFTYSVANPVEGTNVVITDNVDWITTSDDSGTVTVTVEANDKEETREGVITVTYGDLQKTVTVMQVYGDVEINAIFEPGKISSACTKTDDQNNSWAITTDATYFGTTNGYIQVGSNNSPASHLTLASDIDDVKTVTVYAAAKASTSATIKVYIGETLIGTSSVLGNTIGSGGTEFTVENTNNISGKLTIKVSRPSSAKGALYFKKAEVTYTN